MTRMAICDGDWPLTIFVVLAFLGPGAVTLPVGAQDNQTTNRTTYRTAIRTPYRTTNRTNCIDQKTESKHACVWLWQPFGDGIGTCSHLSCHCVPERRCVHGGKPVRIFVCKDQSGGLCTKETSAAADVMTWKHVTKETNQLPVRRHRRAAAAGDEDPVPGVLSRIMDRHRQYNKRSFERGTFFLHGFSRRDRAFIRRRMKSNGLATRRGVLAKPTIAATSGEKSSNSTTVRGTTEPTTIKSGPHDN